MIREMKKKSPKIRIPMALKGWTLYDYDVSPGMVKLIYGHENGAWCVIRPTPDGAPIIIFSPEGEIEDDTEEELSKLLEWTLRGTSGADIDLHDIVLEGEAAEAYYEAGIR